MALLVSGIEDPVGFVPRVVVMSDTRTSPAVTSSSSLLKNNHYLLSCTNPAQIVANLSFALVEQ